MPGRLKDRIAVVTAAGQGIGRAIAEAFVREGATVYASDVDRSKLEGLARAKKAKLDVLSTRAEWRASEYGSRQSFKSQ